MKTIVALPGEGIGLEVVDAACEILAGAGLPLKNPILSAAMMLRHIGFGEEGDRLESAVSRVYRDGTSLTADQGGTARTRDMARAVLAAYRSD